MPSPSFSISQPGVLRWQRPPLALLWLLAWLAAWVLWNSLWDGALYGDNVEQFVWAHSMEWGYHKHPPMPTWLLGAAMALVGPQWWLANAMAGLCFAGTGVLTWLIARRLGGPQVAALTAVLWGLQQSFSVTAHIYNHNTVLVLFVAAFVWAVLRALAVLDRPRQALAWWALSGALAAAAVLSKYQAVLPLAAWACFALYNGRPRLRVVQGLVLAALLCCVLLLPHLLWSVVHHFPSLRYASQALQEGGLWHRLSWVLTFFVNQTRMLFPLLLTCLLAAGVAFARGTWQVRRKPSAGAPQLAVQNVGSVENRPVLAQHSDGGLERLGQWALLWGPLALVVLASLLTGGVLRNHWGVQLCQFFCLWLAWRWQSSPALALPRLLWLAACVHLLGFAYYAHKQSNPLAAQAQSRADAAYPARAMAQAGLALWDGTTNCPLRNVAGDFEAALVSIYSGRNPVVYGDAVSTPWVTARALQAQGALYVVAQEADLPPGLVGKRAWALNAALAPQGKQVWLAVQLPAQPCK